MAWLQCPYQVEDILEEACLVEDDGGLICKEAVRSRLCPDPIRYDTTRYDPMRSEAGSSAKGRSISGPAPPWALIHESDPIRSDPMQCDAMRSDPIRCDAMRCDAMRCGAVRCGAMRCDLHLGGVICPRAASIPRRGDFSIPEKVDSIRRNTRYSSSLTEEGPLPGRWRRR